MTPAARAEAARNFPSQTCAASRHAQMIGEDMRNGVVDPEAGESILSTVASLWEARARIAELEAGYAEAVQDITDWGIYASGYFQEKHNLAGTVARHRAILDAARGGK